MTGPKHLVMVSSGPVPYLNYLGGGEQRRSRRRGKIRPISVDRTEIGWLAARFPYPRQKSAGWLPDPDFYRNTSYCRSIRKESGIKVLASEPAPVRGYGRCEQIVHTFFAGVKLDPNQSTVAPEGNPDAHTCHSTSQLYHPPGP